MHTIILMRFLFPSLSLMAIVLSNENAIADSPAEIYQRRVAPLLKSSKSSSCTECHLQGVKLEDFLTADPKTSFAALRARGWIDMDHPSQSKLLQFISKKSDKPSELIEQVRRAELEAIGAWINACVQDPESLNTPLPEMNDLKLDESLIRHARTDEVLHRFIDIVWSQMERCANCHSPDRNAKQVIKNGPKMSWIVPNSPSETLRLLEERKLIDLEKPAASLLKSKALGQHNHGGGVKFPLDGKTDREWGLFLEDYAAIQKARYNSAAQLPKFESIRTWRTGLHLRINDLPQLPANHYAVIMMHRILSDGSVSEEAIAIGEGRVDKDGTSWTSTLMILEPMNLRAANSPADSPSEWKTKLDAGRYQLRWTASADPKSPLIEILATEAEAVFEIDSIWKSGHNEAKSLSFASFQTWHSK